MDTKVFLGVLLAFLVASQVFQIFFLDHRRDGGPLSRSALPSRPNSAAELARRAGDGSHEAVGSSRFDSSNQQAKANNITLDVFNSSDMVLTLQAVATQVHALRRYIQGNSTSGDSSFAGSLPTTPGSGTQQLPSLGHLTTQALLKRVELFEFFVEAAREDIVEALRSSLAHDAAANYNKDVTTVFTESKQELRRLAQAVAATSDLLARIMRRPAAAAAAATDNEAQHSRGGTNNSDFITAVGQQILAEVVTVVIFARDDTLQGLEPQALLEAIASVKDCLHPRARVLVAAPPSSLAALDAPLLQFVEFVGEISLGELIGLVRTPLLLLLHGGVKLSSRSGPGLAAAIRRLWRDHDEHHQIQSPAGDGSPLKVPPALVGFFSTDHSSQVTLDHHPTSLNTKSQKKNQNVVAVCGSATISDWKLDLRFVDRRTQQANFALHHRDHRHAQVAWDELHLCDVISSSFLGVTEVLQTSMKTAVSTNAPRFVLSGADERNLPFLQLQSRWTHPWAEILALQLCVKSSGWPALVGFAIEEVAALPADPLRGSLPQQWAWEHALASALNPASETQRVLGSESMRQRQLLLLGDAFGFRRVQIRNASAVHAAQESNAASGGPLAAHAGAGIVNIDVGCTVDTPRCPVLPLRQNLPPCCRKKLVKTLHFTSSLLKKHGIAHWIDYGTLLGLARHNGTLVPWEYDADIGIMLDDFETLVSLRQEAHDHGGFHLVQVSDSFARMFVSARNGIYVDIYANEYSSYDGHVYNVASGHVDPFPVALIQPLVNVEFEGGVLPAPNDPDALLDLRYGSDWRTKFKRQAYEGWRTPDEFPQIRQLSHDWSHNVEQDSGSESSNGWSTGDYDFQIPT